MNCVSTSRQPGDDPFEPAARCFDLGGQVVDVLDLKTLLMPRGLHLPEQILTQLGSTRRLAARGELTVNQRAEADPARCARCLRSRWPKRPAHG